ncbi:LysR family transcriptional regulator [Phenylobacterium sp. Root77]|jgi:DNA-binding transcriptional LysR family regulator|uniref:LysR family transcriptional regulator n=1 Tax=unclassified Phenylobacterium TaxID=2640670 RepID=UPI0006FA134A|nr:MULTISPECIES: LysR family transcriptional regulator [unclassified Phenylobacterium]KQW73122.1 LysR family transcriptional regulator [Phenylobacterium sp. Root1277]KQW92341.1 LysR family transcriptional regulator [Phenylobacterium sp. Root1290]KRC40572.1 LysR family transcriptional regulator [Phenylobacterium sp. Root77]
MAKLPDFEAWAIFARVAETGSFARAADELELSKATVSKAVSRLEARLGSSLFHRTSRRLSLTESGRNALERANRILSEGEAVEAETAAQSAIPRGVVRLAAPVSFGLLHMADILPDFLARYPEVTLDVNLADHKVDLVAEGYDLAVRIAQLQDSSLLARKLCDMRVMLVGSPRYFEAFGKPEHPRDLMQHRCLTYTNVENPDLWRFTNAAGDEQSVTVAGPMRVNSSESLSPSLRAGLGVALQPEFICWRDLKDGALETAMCDWRPPNPALHIVSPPGRLRPVRVKVLMDFLAERLAAAPWETGL